MVIRDFIESGADEVRTLHRPIDVEVALGVCLDLFERHQAFLLVDPIKANSGTGLWFARGLIGDGARDGRLRNGRGEQ
jgi:hypothetical protein